MRIAKGLAGVIKAEAQAHGLSPAVIAAICDKESDFDTYAVRYERRWKWLLDPRKWARRVQTSKATEEILQSCSWGLMQVMGTVAREHGFKRDFPVLCIPPIGLKFGCLHLKKFLNKYGDLDKALQAYNAGRPGTRAGRAYASDVLSRVDKYKEL